MSGDEPRPDRQTQLEHELRAAQAELAESQVEANAGNGSVRIVMNGIQECLEVHLAAEQLAGNDPEPLEQLICLAINQAIRESQLLAARRLSPLTDR